MIRYSVSFFILCSDELQNMLVNILVKLVRVAGKELDEYLYHNHEPGCYIRDVIAVDGQYLKETEKRLLKQL